MKIDKCVPNLTGPLPYSRSPCTILPASPEQRKGYTFPRVAELDMEVDGKKIAQYRATTKIYFDIEH